jgi:hypothetical protein
MTNKEIKTALLTPGTQFTVDRPALNCGGQIIFEMSRFTQDREKPGEGMAVYTKSTLSGANVDKITASLISFYTYSPFLTRCNDRIKFSEIEIIRVGQASQEA